MSEVVTQPVAEPVVARSEPVLAAQGRDVGGARVASRSQRGMVSAEWAVGLIAAIAIAGVLLAVVTNGQVKTALMQFILLVIRAFADNI